MEHVVGSEGFRILAIIRIDFPIRVNAFRGRTIYFLIGSVLRGETAGQLPGAPTYKWC